MKFQIIDKHMLITALLSKKKDRVVIKRTIWKNGIQK